ncbi:MAG: hypothetical protein Q8J85_06490 [Sulfuricurvum sp.]|nr:hypothetical protein [Sulfuricurvum sp.]MDP3022517.1 hypothetical protein [Sulfuricurvum sp.]
MPVKPLSALSLQALCERIDYVRNGEIHSLTPISATSIEIRFSVQDKARGFDWIDVAFVIDGVSDAKLASDNALCMLSMDEGITVEMDSTKAALAIGAYKGRIEDSPLYIVGTTMGYEELPYNG